MNNFVANNKSKQKDDFEEDEIFEDSAFLANFENSFIKHSKFSESNINASINDDPMNVSALCCDEEINGYDRLLGRAWIYPTNYPVRDYQFNIIKAGLVNNTLVSLPTGLGKTFIAAVIMYNFYRWYPLGKIVFTAPTRPLVAQQIDACYNIVAIPPNDTIEMTGHMQVNTRKIHWESKRVFFATPQVIYNDIKSGICPANKIRCLVFDEAHRARGNYAYCQIVSTLDEMGHKTYRMLALSATPGSKVEDVINVVKSLHIARLELRSENCIDVAPYSHTRKINTVIVQLGPQLTQLRQQYVEILDGYARRLKQFNILPQNLGNLSKGRIVMLYKEFQCKEQRSRHPQHNFIMKDFTLLIALFHGLELLVKHGSRVFLNFFDEHPEKSWIQADDRLTALLERLRDDLGVNPLSLDRSILPDGSLPEVPKDLNFGHPKFTKLKEIMMEHFTTAKNKGQDTRAIVFCEYRESVNLVHCLLLQCQPLIIPQMFVGQGVAGKEGKAAVSQKQQLRAMRGFRDGASNVLVATCVAEEGLDVGAVDLILCFDVATRSPVRFVQRCGRTGRERGGQVFILVTEGREHQTLKDCMQQKDSLNKRILQSKEVENNLYKLNPRMLPRDFMPQCQKMFITVTKKVDPKESNDKTKKGQKDLRAMLLGNTTKGSSPSKKESHGNLITEDEFKDLYPDGYLETSYIAEPKQYMEMNKDKLKYITKPEDQKHLNLSAWLELQRTLQKTINIGHSKDSEIMSELLQFCDSKRFEQPASTQNPTFNTQEFLKTSPVKKQPKKKQKVAPTKSPAKKDGDIRALFSTATKSTRSYTKLINDLGIQNDGSAPTRLINLLVDLSLENTNTPKTCYVCNGISCTMLKNLKKENKVSPILSIFISKPNLPDIDLMDEFDADSILKCRKLNVDRNVYVTNIGSPKLKNSKDNCSNNFDLEFDFDTQIDSPEVKDEVVNEKDVVNSDKNFDIGDIDDIFADSSPEEAIDKVIEDDKVTNKHVKEELPHAKETLGFFGLDSIEDIFADSDESVDTKTSPDKPSENISENDKNYGKSDTVPHTEYPLSPSILSGRQIVKEKPTSPILCTQPRKFQLSTKKTRTQCSTPLGNLKKELFPKATGNDNVIVIPDAEDRNTKSNTKPSLMASSLADTSNKSMFTITQLVDMINKSNDKSTIKNTTVFDDNIKDNERSMSPILLTQAERKKSSMNFNNSLKSSPLKNKKSESCIVFDSDSDSIDTHLNDLDNIVNESKIENKESHKNVFTPLSSKRKLELDDCDTITSSPYFKKQKIDGKEEKPATTLQERVLAAISSTKTNNSYNNNPINYNFTVTQPNFISQKENKSPKKAYLNASISGEKSQNSKNDILDRLQMFKRDTTTHNARNKFEKNSPKKVEQSQKRKIFFDDSDDDFITDDNKTRSPRKILNVVNQNNQATTTNHKVRKKKRKDNSFLDMEAELSDEDESLSGDELTDDSIGSIIDFICDDNVTHHEDMQAVYLESIKSPVRNGFKIPELPKKFRNSDIFSQFVEEDAYEMDSFCVDSHVGLTQANDLSELELAEIVLAEKNKAKRKAKTRTNYTQQDNDDSPVVKRRNKIVKRQINSDSDDSS